MEYRFSSGEPRRRGNYSYIRRRWDIPKGCPRQSHTRLYRCQADRSTRTTSKRGKRSKLKITSLVVGQIFNFSTGRCARHTAEVRATLKFARKVARASPSPAKFSGREKIKEDINFRKKSYKMRQYKEINFHGKTAGFAPKRRVA